MDLLGIIHVRRLLELKKLGFWPIINPEKPTFWINPFSNFKIATKK